MTAVTLAADAPRAASAISSSSTRFSCTGGTSGWIRYTSRSRQLPCSCTWRQSLANREISAGLRDTPSCAQISSASAGCALPPKITISSSTGRLRRLRRLLRHRCRLVRGQAEPGPYLPLHVVLRVAGVDGDHILLAPEQLQHRVGLGVIVPQSHRERFLGVVLPGDKVSAARVAPAGHCRAVR